MGGEGSGQHMKMYMKSYTIDGLGRFTLREIVKLIDKGLIRFDLGDELKDLKKKFPILTKREDNGKIMIDGTKKLLEVE